MYFGRMGLEGIARGEEKWGRGGRKEGSVRTGEQGERE